MTTTGPLDAPAIAAAQIRIKQINAAGGVDGRKLELIAEDDQGRADLSVIRANKLIDQDKVSAMIACFGAGATAYADAFSMARFHATQLANELRVASAKPGLSVLGDRGGIVRYGSAMIPMDETMTRVSLDASNRPYLIWKVTFSKPKLGEMDTELFKEWFQAFAQLGGLTLHVWNHYGDNNHHIVESCFKGLARALRVAVEIDPRQTTAVPSTKGVL